MDAYLYSHINIKSLKFCLCFSSPVKPAVKADIGIVIDTSAEFNPVEFGPLKDFVTELAERYQISRDANRVGALLFSDEKWQTIPLDQYFDSTEFRNSFNNVSLMNSVTTIDEQLNLAYKKLFSAEGSSRIGVPKIVLLVTHENSLQNIDQVALEKAMRPLKESGIRVMIAAVGKNNTLPAKNSIELMDAAVFLVPAVEDALEDNFLSAITNGSMTTIGMSMYVLTTIAMNHLGIYYYRYEPFRSLQLSL